MRSRKKGTSGNGIRAITKRGAANRDGILKAAMDLFYEQGYQSTTIADIADAAGVLQGSVHYHFRTKDDILYSLLSGVAAEASGVLNAHSPQTSDPVEQLQSALEAHIEYVINHPQTLAITLLELPFLSPRRRRQIERRAKLYNGRFIEIISAGQKQGVFRRDDPELMMRALLGACNWLYRWHNDLTRYASQDARLTLLKFLMRSVVSDAAHCVQVGLQ